MVDYSNRKINYPILEEIKVRWSPRSFSNEKINDDDIKAIIEGARIAPSCFNEQPWRFLYAHRDETIKFEKIIELLTDSNKIWAKDAPVLMIIYAIKKFKISGRENPWHAFDSGTAWGFMSLEATRRGICTHAMGGFDKKKALDNFGLSIELNESDDKSLLTEYTPCAVVAIGKYGNPNELPEELKKREIPSPRLSMEEIILG